MHSMINILMLQIGLVFPEAAVICAQADSRSSMPEGYRLPKNS